MHATNCGRTRVALALLCTAAALLCAATPPALCAPPTELTSPAPEPNNGNHGFAIAFVGDLNADGHCDLLVGARGEGIPAGGSSSDATGRAYIYSGSDGSVLFTHVGLNNGDRFGDAVAGGGDFDGDGTPDYAIGAPSADPDGLSAAGSAYIYSGATHALLHQIDGAFASGQLGVAMDFVGNIPRDDTHGADTFDDLVVAGPGSSSFANPRVFIVGFEVDASLTPVVVATSVPRNSGDRRFGRSVAGVGDFDGDGVPDVGITAPNSTGFSDFFTNRGRAYVYSGATILTSRTKLLSLQGVTGSAQEQFGSSIDGAGNFDGSGANAVVIGGSGANSSAGSIEVIAYVAGNLAGDRLLRVDGFASNNSFGRSAAGIGDVNADGFDDVLIGAPGSSTGNFPGGEAFVIAGAAGAGFVEDLQTTTRKIFQAGDLVTIDSADSVGQSVAGGCDLDNDGRPDWAVGAPGRDATGLTNDGTVILSTAAEQFPPPDPTGVTITTPVAADVINGAAVIFTATADNAGEVEFFVNGTSVGVDVGAGPQYAVTFDSTLLPDGPATLTIEARNDNGGLAVAGPVTVEVDNSSPLLAITAPAPDAVVGGTVDFTAEASDPNGVTRVTLTAGTTLSFTDLAAPYATDLDTTLEVDGPLTLTVEAEDDLGNIGTESLSVLVDNTPPTIVISSHADGDFVSGPIAIAVDAIDPNLDRVEVRVDSLLIATITDFSSPISIAFDTTGLPDGALALEATAFDAAGNNADTGAVVQIDNTAPDKVIACPSDGQRVRNVIQVHVAAEDGGSGIAAIDLFAGAQPLGSTTAGTLTVPFDTRTVLDGLLPIVCIVTDLAGNERIETVTVEVDNLRLRLRPNRLHLGSCWANAPVWLSIHGASVGLLAPISDHTIQLSYPGGFSITATGGWDAPCYGHLLARFDRSALISAVNGEFGTDPPRRIVLDVIADGQQIGKVSLRLRKWRWSWHW